MKVDVEVLKREIEELHSDLAQWLSSEASQEVFDRFAAQQHSDFSLVSVSGEVVRREHLLDSLRSARNAVPGLRIDVDDVTPLVVDRECGVARFLESQHGGGSREHRIVTATLIADPQARNGLRWLAVHETAASEPTSPR